MNDQSHGYSSIQRSSSSQFCSGERGVVPGLPSRKQLSKFKVLSRPSAIPSAWGRLPTPTPTAVPHRVSLYLCDIVPVRSGAPRDPK